MSIAARQCIGVKVDRVTQSLYTGVSELVRLTNNGNTAYPELSDGVLNLYNASIGYGRGYAVLPFTTLAWNKQYDVVCCVDWKGFSNYYGILGSLGNGDGFTPFWANKDIGIVSYLHNVGWPVSWQGGSQRAAAYPTHNKKIYMRLTFDGVNTYRFWTSDGTLWTNTATKVSSATVQGGDVLQIGSNRGQDSMLNALVDLNYCYIKYDGEILWNGTPGAYDRVHKMIADGM